MVRLTSAAQPHPSQTVFYVTSLKLRVSDTTVCGVSAAKSKCVYVCMCMCVCVCVWCVCVCLFVCACPCVCFFLTPEAYTGLRAPWLVCVCGRVVRAQSERSISQRLSFLFFYFKNTLASCLTPSLPTPSVNMAAKAPKPFQIAVCGLTSSVYMQTQQGQGAGKSFLCNRFVRPNADDQLLNHPSVLNHSDYGGTVVNNTHFLYWGEKAVGMDNGEEVKIQVSAALRECALRRERRREREGREGERGRGEMGRERGERGGERERRGGERGERGR